MDKFNVKELENYWRVFFNSNNENYLEEMPKELLEHFNLEYLPEPYYGYLTEDMSEDVVLLLLNPGAVDLKVQEQFFNAKESEHLVQLANAYVVNRHLDWSKEDYLKQEQVNYPGRDWRRKKLLQCEKLVGHNIPFLHTIELFPYHSKNWNMKKSLKQDWLYNLKSTHLFVNSVEEIAKNKLSKYVFGIGKDWVEILNRYPEKFKLSNYEEISGPKGGRAHSIYQFKVIGSSDALPIIIYSGVSMNLPVNDERAVEVFRGFLNK